MSGQKTRHQKPNSYLVMNRGQNLSTQQRCICACICRLVQNSRHTNRSRSIVLIFRTHRTPGVALRYEKVVPCADLGLGVLAIMFIVRVKCSNRYIPVELISCFI